MAYRKSYYRKDGTYVSDSFDSRKSRKSTHNNNNNNNNDSGGCVLIIGCIIFLVFARDIIFNDHAWYWKLLFGFISLIIILAFAIKMKKVYQNYKSNSSDLTK